MNPDIFFILFGMGVVTYIPRWLPLFLFSRRSLPPGLRNG